MGLNGSVGTPDRPSPFTLAPGRIGAAGIAFFALAAVTPLTVVATVVPAAYAMGVPDVPLVLLAAGVVMLLFSVGYVAMARRAPHAGPLSAFVARGLGRPVGVGAGWLAVLSYNALQIALYGAVGAAAAPLLASWFGVTAQWWMVAAGCWLVVALCGVVRVEVAGGLLALLVLAEVAVLTGFGAANLLEPAAGRITWDTLEPTRSAAIDRPVLGLLLVVGALTFIGVETAAAYGEEARGPRRTLPRAIYVSVALIALLYAASAWATSVAVGPDRIAAVAADRGPELVFDLAAARLTPWAVTLGRVLLLTGLLAAMISLHHTIARYLFALGREGVLPGRLGRTGRRTSAPRAASLTQSVLAAAAIGACAGFRLDPTTRLFHQVATVGALGVLLLLLGASLAALLDLNRSPNGVWRGFLAPGLSTVALGALAYLAGANLPALLDVAPGDPLVLIVPAVFGGLLLLGIVYGLVLRRARPVGYAGLGLGGTAVVVTPAVPRPRIPRSPRAPGAHRPERVDS
jgi:amino acid transporter